MLRLTHIGVVVGLMAEIAHADRMDPAAGESPVHDFLSAVQRNDAKAAAGFVAKWPLVSYYVWFESANCQKAFGGSAKVAEADFPTFVSCLKALELRANHRETAYESDPGIAVMPSFVKGQLRVLRGARPVDAASPTILATNAIDHAPVTSFDVTPSAADKATLDKSHEAVSSMVQFCINAKGRTESVSVEDDTKSASYGTTVVATVKGWVFKPFLRKGKAIRVCTGFITSYPPGSTPYLDLATAPPPPPPPPPPPGSLQTVPPTLLEGLRIKGEKNILPDDDTKTAITRSGNERVIASTKLCISVTGDVTSVSVLKQSGFPAYDAKLVSEMKKWAYKPYVVDGKATPVCTAVTFVYAQR